MLLSRRALRQELSWLGLCTALVMAAMAVGVDAAPALAAGLAGYAGWHLVQALRLLRFLSHGAGPDPGAPRAWGVWYDVLDRVAWLMRRERRRKRRQRRFFSRFREIASAMPDGVLILAGTGEVSWLNQQAAVFFGIDDGKALGHRLADLVDNPILRGYLETANFSRVLEIEAPGDRTRMLAISVTRFKRGRQRFLLVARDITRSYHLNRSQRDFTLNVSHELRTPLTVLHGYLETLFDAADEDAPHRIPLLRMMVQTRRMQDVIQDLSMLSTLEAGLDTVRHEPVAVLDMLEDIVEEGRALARDTHHLLDISGDPGLLLLGDESLLRCAFSNLVFNAIRHTPGRTRVRITWGLDGDRAALQVQDNGAGIPARHLPRLTERFYRVDAGRSRDAGGSGLGLALVSQILDMHDARLRIHCEEGRGCRFRCEFPASKSVQVPGLPGEG